MSHEVEMTPEALGREYIRVGSYTQPLAKHPEKERALWALFERAPFEAGIAADGVSSDEVLSLIDYPEYFRLMEQPLPDNRDAILGKLCFERIIAHRPGDSYDITNLGAILGEQGLRDRFRGCCRVH